MSIVNKSLILKKFRTVIVCSNIERMNRVCTELILKIPLDIAKFRKTQHSGFFEFPNGSTINVCAIKIGDNHCGKRAHNLFVDDGIDREIVDVVLQPILAPYVNKPQIEFF